MDAPHHPGSVPMMAGIAAGAVAALVATALRPRAPRHHAEAAVPPARWVHAVVRRVRRERPTEAWPDVLELVVLAVRAGHLPVAAIALVAAQVGEPYSGAFHDVVHAVHGGARFADAVAALRHTLGPDAVPLADQLAAADRDGLPLAPVLERLALDARTARRRQADATARELPVRLALPLVLCTLPSFVLLAVAPLVLAAISALRH